MPPFRLDVVVWALRRRADNIVDQWDGTTYSRTLEHNDRLVRVMIVQTGSIEHPEIRARMASRTLDFEVMERTTATLDKMLGLSIDLTPFHAFAAKDRWLKPLVARFRGFKPPRFPTLFEALINAIACQQFSLTNGIHLLNRLAARGTASLNPASWQPPPFPSPARLAHLSIPSLRKKGFSYQKALSMTALAKAMAKEELDLEPLVQLDNEAAIERLETLHGVGRWSAEYVLLRGLGRTNLFPGDDVGARNNLQRWLRLRKPLDYDRVHEVLGHWRPYAGLLYFHLLLKNLAEAGYLA